MLLGELFLHLLAGVHDAGHVDFVEGGQASVGVLGLLEAAGDGLAHLVHGDAGLEAGAADLGGSLLRGDGSHVRRA